MIIPEKVSAYFNRLNLIFHALIALPLLLFIYLFLEAGKGVEAPLAGGRIPLVLLLVFYAFGSLLVFWSFRRYRYKASECPSSAELWSKLRFYQHLALYHYLLLTGVLSLMTLGFYLSQHRGFTVGFVLVMVALSIHRPTLDKICRDLGLTREEREQVMGKTETTM